MKKKSGFTILEATLVIALAGLLFVAIAIAIPALIRSQRDTDRRHDISALISKIKEYQSNNRKALPSTGEANRLFYQGVENISFQTTSTTEWSSFLNNDLPRVYYDADNRFHNEFADPNGNLYQFSIVPCDPSVGVGGSCNQTQYQYSADSGMIRAINTFLNAQFPNDYLILIVLNSKCGSDNSPIYIPGNKSLSIMYRLENTGTYCENN